MQCPVDGTTLAMTTREGVEIDYCPKCRGVWLDRGELDKIIEKEGASAAPNNAQGYAPQPVDGPYMNQQQGPRRGGFMGRLFDGEGYGGGGHHGHH